METISVGRGRGGITVSRVFMIAALVMVGIALVGATLTEDVLNGIFTSCQAIVLAVCAVVCKIGEVSEIDERGDE